MSYLGISYGAPLGAAFATAYPALVRAAVLDAAYHPAYDPVEAARASAVSEETRLATLYDECDDNPDCPIDDEMVSGEIDQLQSRLRADVASGISISAADERRLADRVAHRVELHDERRRLDARLSGPPPLAGPHDHLRHRRLPSPQPPPRRRRILAVWSAVSTPLILAFVGVEFLPHGSVTVTGSATFVVFVVFAIEAIARSNLVRFVLTLVVLGALIAVGTTLAGLTVFFGWQTTVAVCFFALAVLLVINNLRELARD